MKESEKTQRKILKTGNYTYMLTLPKEWVKRLGWRSKQIVELEIKDNRIVVKDYPNV
ncbi:MAG: AbrB/MazE/SpoVT family DNA-binding domain-containing protein [Candidatus Omnitrophica bacterium]|nr:AbrB/MazE/SpoVT family DNA-binding domain-containing protein [Candidatus Omnitrophota bacterium]